MWTELFKNQWLGIEIPEYFSVEPSSKPSLFTSGGASLLISEKRQFQNRNKINRYRFKEGTLTAK